MKIIQTIAILVMSSIFSYPLFSSAQTDSTCNYYYITQQQDAYYDSLLTIYGDSGLEGTGYTQYIRWKEYMYFRENGEGDLFAHQQYIEDYYEGTRNIPDIETSEWKYFGPRGVPGTPLGSWQNPGGNGKGMMISLYIYPDNHNKILAGSHNSGLWKTEDGGNTWTCLTDNNYKIRGVNSIIVDPNDPNTICISSFNTLSLNSYGLFCSTDGGVSWTEMNEGLNIHLTLNPLYPSGESTRYTALPRKLMIRPSDGDLYYITHSYVFKADDFNSTWSEVFYHYYEHWLYDKGFFDIEFAPYDNDIIYLSGTDIHKSTNGGEDWSDITDDVIGGSLEPRPLRAEICVSVKEESDKKVWFNYTYNCGSDYPNMKLVRYDPESSPQYYTYPLDESTSASAFAMEFEISLLDENLFYFGAINDLAYDALTDEIFSFSTSSVGPNNPNWIHLDIREMKIVPGENNTAKMFIAHDGGISWAVCEGHSGSDWSWDFLPGDDDHGLDVYEFYDFASLDDKDDLVIGGTQDLSGFTYFNNTWHHTGTGDGGEAIIDNRDESTTYVYYYCAGGFVGFLFRSEDNGLQWEQMFHHPSQSLFTALSLHPFEDTWLYYAADKLYFYSNAREQYNPVVKESIDNDEPLSDIEIVHDGGPGHITYNFISSRKNYSWAEIPVEPEDYEKCFWEGIPLMPGNNDKSAYMLGLTYGYITDIETNPNNPTQLWTAYGKASTGDGNSTKKIYISNDHGAGEPDSWEPFVEGFPEGVPVRKLLYDHKYNRLYCASDIGVWVRDLNLEDHEWVEFNNNLPFKIVTDLEIIYSQNKLRAATYGRGIWESSIYCYYDVNNPYVVNGSEEWSEDKLMTGDIKILNGGELKITGCKVSMPTNSKIIVQNGGKLILDGAYLTDACDHLWEGIEVWGDPSEAHNETNQGCVESKGNSIIENATYAIYAGKRDENGYNIPGFGGAILAVDETLFRNNHIAVGLTPYQMANKTKFYTCSFETNEAILDNQHFDYFVVMMNYNFAEFRGCDFSNNRLAADVFASQRGIGVYSIESMFLIDKYEDNFLSIETEFNNLYYGVKSLSISTTRKSYLGFCNFNNNVTGAYFSGVSNQEVLNCDFQVMLLSPSYEQNHCGLYLDNCTGYWIEGNEFTGTTLATVEDYKIIGLTVNNSGESPNELYRNYFNYLDIGILAQNTNRSSPNGIEGLFIKCNKCGLNGQLNKQFDISVTAYEEWENAGIKRNQGDNESPSGPAGNMFSHYMNGPYDSDYNNSTEEEILYFQHDPEPIELELQYHTQILIGVDETGIEYDENESCPPKGTTFEINELNDLIVENENNADSVDAILDALVDGGNTQELESDVIISTPPEAYMLHTDLMNKSPFLTDTVMIEAIQKEDVLTPIMVKEVLVANPQSAKSEEVMTELDNRINPLPDYMIAEIEAGKDTLGDKELMEATKSFYRHERSIYMNMLKTIYKFDTLDLGYSDSLLTLLQNENTVKAKYELAFEHINRGEYASASSVINNITNQFTLSSGQVSIHQKYDSIMPVITDLYQNNKSVFELDSLQLNLLASLATDSTSMPGTYARNILVYIGQMMYNEPYILPDTSLKAEDYKEPGSHKKNSPPKFKVYPNPASDYLVIEYNLKSEGCDGYVLLRDNLGKTVKQVSINSNMYSRIISTSGITSGVYYLSLICNEQTLMSTNVVIGK
jgi:hypothetical protein